MPRARVLCDCLLDVEEAGTKPLQPPGNYRLAPLFSYFCGNFKYLQKKSCIYPTSSTRNSYFFYFPEKSGMNVRHVSAAFWNSNAAKSPFCDKKSERFQDRIVLHPTYEPSAQDLLRIFQRVPKIMNFAEKPCLLLKNPENLRENPVWIHIM
jgi:hypothetical protein